MHRHCRVESRRTRDPQRDRKPIPDLRLNNRSYSHDDVKKSFGLAYAAAMLAAGAIVLASANGASAASRHSNARAAFGFINKIRHILNKPAPGFVNTIHPIIVGGL